MMEQEVTVIVGRFTWRGRLVAIGGSRTEARLRLKVYNPPPIPTAVWDFVIAGDALELARLIAVEQRPLVYARKAEAS